MRFKDFEISPTTYCDGHIDPNRYDVVKWYKTDKPIEVLNLNAGEKRMEDTFCFSIANIIWNDDKNRWEFESVGQRFLEHYEDGLCKFILKWMELFDICKESEDE